VRAIRCPCRARAGAPARTRGHAADAVGHAPALRQRHAPGGAAPARLHTGRAGAGAGARPRHGTRTATCSRSPDAGASCATVPGTSCSCSTGPASRARGLSHAGLPTTPTAPQTGTHGSSRPHPRLPKRHPRIIPSTSMGPETAAADHRAHAPQEPRAQFGPRPESAQGHARTAGARSGPLGATRTRSGPYSTSARPRAHGSALGRPGRGPRAHGSALGRPRPRPRSHSSMPTRPHAVHACVAPAFGRMLASHGTLAHRTGRAPAHPAQKLLDAERSA
jgi:hypothetical protein